MHLFAVVALKRHDYTEAVIALRAKENDARRSAREYAAAIADKFVRCRVQPMDLTVDEIKAVCFRWGQEDARSGESAPNTLPGVYAEEYQRGFASVQIRNQKFSGRKGDGADDRLDEPV